MKKLVFLLVMMSVVSMAFAQQEKDDDDKKGKFNINNMFVGGSINLGAGSGFFQLGAVPEIGYSITQWLDAGILFNLNYQTQKIYDGYSGAVVYKIRAFNYGTGAFVRVWPIKEVFIALQPEYNWIKQNQIDVYSNAKTSYTFKAESFLVGIGYGSKDIGRQLTYVTLMIDLMQNINSPYRDQYNHAQPVFRTGVGFYLGSKRR
jgi:hypothetical protein